MTPIKAPFPWFGGKRTVAADVWQRLGDVPNYVEPFAGSLAVLLGRPDWPWPEESRIHAETVNDLDGCVTNFWRAIQHDPEQTAVWADNPVHELDLHARHLWLHARLKSVEGLDDAAKDYAESKGVLPFAARLTMDPAAYDCQVAGWWVWGLCSWIGDNWSQPSAQMGRPRLFRGQGVSRQLPHLDAGKGTGACEHHRAALIEWFSVLSDRLRHVDICCGDWERVSTFTPTEKRAAPCGVFLDPPYSQDCGVDTVYGDFHLAGLSGRVRDWCLDRGDSPDLRIALCGYEGEHEMPITWECVAWKAQGGYANQGGGSKANRHRERIWFSPNCLKPTQRQANLFAGGQVC